MDVLKLGPLRARRFVKTSGSTQKNATTSAPLTIVLMHGYGAPGDDLVGIGGAIDVPAGTTFLFPEAPLSLGDAAMMSLLGDARAWWHIDVGRYQRAMMQGTLNAIVDEIPDGLKEAREQLVAMLDAYEAETKTPGTSPRIVLGGFSQGSMLATDVALRTKRPLAGLVVLSGTLLAAKEWLPLMSGRKDLRVFQSHGTADPILPFPIAERLRHSFEEAGMKVSFQQFDGGHGIPPEVMRDLGIWLKTA